MLYLEFLPLLTCQKKNKMANTKSERRKSIQTKYTMTISRKIYFCLLFYYYLFCSFLRLILAHSMVYFHKFHKVFFLLFSRLCSNSTYTQKLRDKTTKCLSFALYLVKKLSLVASLSLCSRFDFCFTFRSFL